MKILKQILVAIIVVVVGFFARNYLKSGGVTTGINDMIKHIEDKNPVYYDYTATTQTIYSSSLLAIYNDDDNFYQKLTNKELNNVTVIEVIVTNGELKAYINDEDFTEEFLEKTTETLLTEFDDVFLEAIEVIEVAKSATSSTTESKVEKSDDYITVTGIDTSNNNYEFIIQKDGSKIDYTSTSPFKNENIDIVIKVADHFDIPVK